MNPLGKPHIFPFIQAVSAAFLEAGGAVLVSSNVATTIMLMASGSTEVIADNYNMFYNFRLSPNPDDQTWGSPEFKMQLRGVDGWNVAKTSNRPDGSRWLEHQIKVVVSTSGMNDVALDTIGAYTRFVVCALSVVENVQRVIDDYAGFISYQIMTPEEVKKQAEEAAAARATQQINDELRTAVDYIRKGMRVEGKCVTIPRALIPESMKTPGTYKISFDDYGGKVTKRYEVHIPSSNIEPYVKRVSLECKA